MESVVVFAMIFVEIYSSSWADLLGRKKTIILGSFIYLISIIIFIFIDSPFDVWFSNILMMIGFSIVSGADEAFLVDTLKDANRSDELMKILGDVNSKKYILAAISCLAAGYLYSIDPRLPFILSFPGVLVSFLLVFFFDEPKRLTKVKHSEHFNLMKVSILFVTNHKALKWVIAYIALITVASKLWFFTYNPYFEVVDLDLKYFGWIFAGLNLVAYMSSKFAYKIEEYLGEKSILIWMILIIAMPMFLMGFLVSKFAVLLVLMENITRGFRGPFFSKFINKHLDSKNRATILSIQSAVISVISAISLFIFGIMLDIYSLPVNLEILAVAVIVIGAFLIYKYGVIFQKK